MLLGIILFILSGFLLVSSVFNKVKIKHIKNEKNIHKGKITYTDLNKPAKPFFSKIYRLSGKPDYIIKDNQYYIPIEVKTGKHNEPQKNHIFQLAAYCHLLEENYGGFVPFGILVYNDNFQYKIPFDPKIRFELESTIKKMKHSLKTGRIMMNHSDNRRCMSCSMRSYCNIKI